MRVNTAVLFLALFLSGCVSPHSPGQSTQSIAPGISLTLPFNPPFSERKAVQLVEAHYKTWRQGFQSVIETTPTRFELVVLVPSGPRLLQVDWAVNGIRIKRDPLAPEGLPAERLLADLMLIYAPDDVLRKALRGGALANLNGGRRSIYRNRLEVIRITRPESDPWNGESVLEHLLYHYKLVVRSRSDDDE